MHRIHPTRSPLLLSSPTLRCARCSRARLRTLPFNSGVYPYSSLYPLRLNVRLQTMINEPAPDPILASISSFFVPSFVSSDGSQPFSLSSPFTFFQPQPQPQASPNDHQPSAVSVYLDRHWDSWL
ncbi:hypothetical protein GALMADRAFT_453880 [Galerina marginata CBS 339.88]|uniref:Uncharacterized protein n=1 Tax=Galerina marginata (strain CBS 339.88) TaxID=685588 RepID=A0A067TA03_GALM3|nr:hypothetical protein GALMADRAFT_453880 [Galerina marginata CBS 339.88]